MPDRTDRTATAGASGGGIRMPLPVRRMLVGLLACAWFCVAPTHPCRAGATPYPDPPQALFANVFVAIQQASVYADGKLFADAVPKETPATIRSRYRLEQPTTKADLRAFADTYFVLPSADEATNAAADDTAHPAIGAHIDELWQRLTRSTPTVPAHSSQ